MCGCIICVSMDGNCTVLVQARCGCKAKITLIQSITASDLSKNGMGSPFLIPFPTMVAEHGSIVRYSALCRCAY
ncbi:unnamed protein product [Tuber melanosporum]|uniref:(Perigord truffle) hypothetical protein n=1 Tax=Tuber melanosporum (strain Mel28) TaxID=656061 RepID=D5G9D6_TUBMM|nr:uncharacterized protein GSTUM_00003259001 [Tuber melanosporum]CAZ81129.1 unnamed protein product [Tuber melanosporum]